MEGFNVIEAQILNAAKKNDLSLKDQEENLWTAAAGREEAVRVDLVRVNGRAVWQAVNVNLVRVGGYPISKGELLGKK